jgi:cytochrome c oxidase subunit II
VPLAEEAIVRSEVRWAAVAISVMSVIMLAIIYAGLVHHINPPSNIETIDPKTLHLSGEFTEANLGTRVAPDGQVTSRIVATQFTFLPRCIVVPANRPVTLRFATPDVIHGVLVTGTNVNTMIVPGYVSQVHTEFTRPGELLMPCHEYCGLGHSEMAATVRVVAASAFKPDAQGRASCDAR